MPHELYRYTLFIKLTQEGNITTMMERGPRNITKTEYVNQTGVSGDRLVDDIDQARTMAEAGDRDHEIAAQCRRAGALILQAARECPDNVSGWIDDQYDHNPDNKIRGSKAWNNLPYPRRLDNDAQIQASRIAGGKGYPGNTVDRDNLDEAIESIAQEARSYEQIASDKEDAAGGVVLVRHRNMEGTLVDLQAKLDATRTNSLKN